ncbi:MAG: hypothetical protein R6V04_08745 [bacterium]
MKKISMLQLRKNSKQIIQWARQGKKMILTYRGNPVFRIEPIQENSPDENDLFYSIDKLAVDEGQNITNQKMDTIIYE